MKTIYCIIKLLNEKSFFFTVREKINTVIIEIKSVIIEILSVIISLLSNNNFTMQYICSPNADKTTRRLLKNLSFCSLFHMKQSRKHIVNLLFK